MATTRSNFKAALFLHFCTLILSDTLQATILGSESTQAQKSHHHHHKKPEEQTWLFGARTSGHALRKGLGPHLSTQQQHQLLWICRIKRSFGDTVTKSKRASAFSRVLSLQTLKICSAFFYMTSNFCYPCVFKRNSQIFTVSSFVPTSTLRSSL